MSSRSRRYLFRSGLAALIVVVVVASVYGLVAILLGDSPGGLLSLGGAVALTGVVLSLALNFAIEWAKRRVRGARLHIAKADTPGPRARTFCDVSLHLGLHLLPPDARERYEEEWDAERKEFRSRWARMQFTIPLLLVAIPRMAWTLRVGAQRRERR